MAKSKLINPKTGQIKMVYDFKSDDPNGISNNFSKEYFQKQVKKYLDEGWKPTGNAEAQGLKEMGFDYQGVPNDQAGMSTQDRNYFNQGVDVNRMNTAAKTADYITGMSPYAAAMKSNADFLNTQARGTGPMDYTKAMLDMQDVVYGNDQNTLRGQNVNDLASAYSNLSMTGGFDSGAQERLYTAGNKNLMNTMQNLSAQNNQTRSGYMAEDARSKYDILQNNPYAQLQGDWMTTAGNKYGEQ